MSEFKNDDDLKNFLQNNAPVAPAAAPDALEKMMRKIGLRERPHSFRHWLFPVSAVASFLAVSILLNGYWAQMNTKAASQPVAESSTEALPESPTNEDDLTATALTWYFIDDDDDIEIEGADIGDDFLLLASAVELGEF